MNVLKRCHFQLKGGAKFDELRTSLQDLVDCLITICPNQTAIHMSLLGDAAGSSQIMDLETMRNIYEEEANRRREKGQSYQEYELVKDVAGFKARVQTLTEKRAHLLEERLRNKENPGAFLLSNGSVRFWNKRDVRYGEDRWEFREGNSTLAINDKDQLIHYIVSVSSNLEAGVIFDKPTRSGSLTETVTESWIRKRRATSWPWQICLASATDPVLFESCHVLVFYGTSSICASVSYTNRLLILKDFKWTPYKKAKYLGPVCQRPYSHDLRGYLV